LCRKVPLRNLQYLPRFHHCLRSLTRQEEKNDAEEDTDGSTSTPSGAAQSVMEDDGENESAPDLDASMEDLDEDAAAETEDNDETDEDYTEEFERNL